MKQKLIKIIWIILVLLVIIICITTMGNASAINPNSERIAELSYNLNELESHKNLCLDNLPYKESVDNANWIHTYCNMYDELIMKYQEEIEKLKEWRPAASETETAWTSEIREPWMLNESWDAQVMPNIVADTSHERFKKLCEAYWLDASTIWQVEQHYGLTEATILCVTVAETSWGKRGAGAKNIGSVGSNDRWNRPTYALMEAWLEDIGKTLTNKYLWSKQTLWCLSNAWHCTESWDNGKRYATSTSSREKNMVACLSQVYWPINPSTFNIRQR